MVRDHSNDLNLLSVCPKDSDWTRQKCRLEDLPKVRLKDSDWTRQIFRLEDRLKVRPKDSDWTKEATFPYDDASDSSSCRTDMIGRERKLVLSSGTLLIGRSDWTRLAETLLIGRSD